MNERDFFNEKEEVKKATYSCPHCRERAEYDVRWLTRTKKPQPPRGANEMDRARFQKSRDYMVRIDDMLACRNVRCRRRFEIPSSQSVVFIWYWASSKIPALNWPSMHGSCNASCQVMYARWTSDMYRCFWSNLLELPTWSTLRVTKMPNVSDSRYFKRFSNEK